MIDESVFEAAIRVCPDPDRVFGLKLMFADFLEEEGQYHRAETMREQVALAAAPQFSPDQLEVVEKIERWAARPDTGYLTLGGYAGTGKSTIIRHLVSTWQHTAVAALCGKAANVLRVKGCKRAQTIHSLIYELIPETHPPRFRRKQNLWIGGERVRRIIIDEASMVDEQILADLMRFDIPVLFVGDHGQLEPVGRDAGLMREPMLTLTQIHRQAADNPIIRLAAAFRLGKKVPYWEDPRHRVSILPKSEFWNAYHPGMTAICSFNKTRHKINQTARKKLRFDNPLPEPGDRLVCLKNNMHFEIFNGMMATVEKRGSEDGGGNIHLTMRLDDDRLIELPCVSRQFGIETLDPREVHQGTTLWDFGYGLTAHKSQGSEFDTVIVLDQPSPLWNMNRLRYTTATRAAYRLIYCL